MSQSKSLIQKKDLLDFIIFIIVIFGGSLIGIIYGVEKPVWIGKKSASISILILSVFFFGLRIYFLKKQNRNFNKSVILFFIAICISVKISFYKTEFNSNKWKSSININHLYANTPAHNAGNMIEDIVKNNLTIGKSTNEVIEMLGEKYFTEKFSGKYVKYYFYRGSIFDGCDKLWLKFENNICVKSGIAGCD